MWGFFWENDSILDRQTEEFEWLKELILTSQKKRCRNWASGPDTKNMSDLSVGCIFVVCATFLTPLWICVCVCVCLCVSVSVFWHLLIYGLSDGAKCSSLMDPLTSSALADVVFFLLPWTILYIYIFSQQTKVQMDCTYINQLKSY